MGTIFLKTPPAILEHAAQERHEAKVYREHHGGLLPDNSYWDYLRYRWSLNPIRFDHWHPIMGRWIDKDWHLRHDRHHVPPPPECHESCPPPPPPVCHQSMVPEPSTFILLAIGLIVVAALTRGFAKFVSWTAETKSPKGSGEVVGNGDS